MRTNISVIALLVFCASVCSAQDPDGCHEHVFAFDPDEEQVVDQFLTVSDFAKLQECPTSSAFCAALVSVRPTQTITVHATTSGTARGTTVTILESVFTETQTTTARPMTLTKGSSTITQFECKPAVTCGAVTFTRSLGTNLGLTQACSCAVQQITVTKTMIHSTITLKSIPKVTQTVSLVKTVTATSTSTVSRPTAFVTICSTLPRPKRQCKNDGVQWAAYTIEPQDVQGRGESLQDWNVTAYKSRDPFPTGTSRFVGHITGSYYYYEEYVYGDELATANLAVNHRGYLYAAQNGSYTFTIPRVSTVADLWVGDVAFSGWNISNTVLSARSTDGFKLVKIQLEAGNYYPMRVLWGLGNHTEDNDGLCGQKSLRCGDFYFQIIRPDGKFVVGYQNTEGVYTQDEPDRTYDGYGLFHKSPDAVQFSCDGTSAPMFPPFGQET